MPLRQEISLLYAEAVLLIGSGIVINTDGDLGRLLGFSIAGGAVGGGAGLLIALNKRVPFHEIARRWFANTLAALILGPFLACWVAAQDFAAPVPGPVVILTASALCGFFGVGLLLSIRGLYRSWITSTRRRLFHQTHPPKKPRLP